MIKRFQKQSVAKLWLNLALTQSTSIMELLIVSVFAQGNWAPIRRIVEKPNRNKAPSNLSVVGRYVFLCRNLAVTRWVAWWVGGEIQLTDAIDVSY